MNDTNTLSRNDVHDYVATHYDTLGGWLVLRSVDISEHPNTQQFMLHLHRHGIEAPGADVILALKYLGEPPSKYPTQLYLWDNAIWCTNVSTEQWTVNAGIMNVTLLSRLNA